MQMYKKGTFNRYLYNSGSFVTLMVKAITKADRENQRHIEKAFPQMVAAYKNNSWDEAPAGFEPCYNGKKLREEFHF